MRPIYGCSEYFRDSLTTPMATKPNIFHGLLFRSTRLTDPVNVPKKMKSVALPVPEIIAGTQNIWAVPGYAYALFSAKFLMGFYYRLAL